MKENVEMCAGKNLYTEEKINIYINICKYIYIFFYTYEGKCWDIYMKMLIYNGKCAHIKESVKIYTGRC